MKNDDIATYLEKRLMYFYPKRYLRKYVKSTEDIYENRASLKEISFDDDSMKYLTNLIAEDIRTNKRFKKYECLKVLKRVLKNRKSVRKLDSSIVEDLFDLYKEFIFSKNEEVQWCVSTFIKDRILDNEDINWLISNYKKSEHIINRLLRYPVHSDLVRDWAQRVYFNGELRVRLSEVIAILVTDDISEFVDTRNTDVIIWAIYYAKCSDVTKQNLIRKYTNLDAIDTTLEVAMRLGYPSIIEYLLVRHIGDKG